jgi:hypothetical protein
MLIADSALEKSNGTYAETLIEKEVMLTHLESISVANSHSIVPEFTAAAHDTLTIYLLTHFVTPLYFISCDDITEITKNLKPK